MEITPEMFEVIATKQDLAELKVLLKGDLSELKVSMRQDLKELEERVASKDDFNKVMTGIDGLANRFDKFDQEGTANMAAHDRMDGRIENHEVRIKSLEAAA